MNDCLYRIQHFDDESAFKSLYQQYMFPLFQFAFSFLHSKEASEEVVNDVFLRLWQKRHNLDSVNNIKLYLYGGVRNGCLNHLKKQKKTATVDLDDVQTDHFQFSSDAQQIYQTSELRRVIQESINSLPPKCKLVFKLVKEDSLTYKEVAAILNISTKTVDNQLVTALKKLQLALQPFLSDFPAYVAQKNK